MGRAAIPTLVAAAFVAVQAALPARALVGDGFDASADFAWSMFSRKVRCGDVQAWAEVGGSRAPVDLKADFPSWYRFRRVLTPDRLRTWANERCAALPAGSHLRVELTCTDGNGAGVHLASAGEDLCAR